MAEKPKWLDYIYKEYKAHGLGRIIVTSHGRYQFTTDCSENPESLKLMNASDDIKRDVRGWSFWRAIPKHPENGKRGHQKREKPSNS